MDQVAYNRLRWNCRRGMLENDIVLERFLVKHAADLDAGRIEIFNTLLEYGDNDLWDLISGRAECRDVAQAEVVGWLRNC